MIQGEGFINEHDWDIIPDRIHKLAGIADKAVALFIENNIALAFRAGQNFEQFFADCHGNTFSYGCAYFKELEHICGVASTCMLAQRKSRALL